MHYKVSEQGQMNVEISNLVTTDSELDALRDGLTKTYGMVENFVAKDDGQARDGTRFIVRFVVPGPMLFQDECADLLHSLGLVRWHIEAQATARGTPAYF